MKMKIDPNAPLFTLARPPHGGEVWHSSITVRALIAAVLEAGMWTDHVVSVERCPEEVLAKKATKAADALLSALNEEERTEEQ